MSQKTRTATYIAKIRELRKNNRLTQQDVADILHVAQTTYSDYEHGYTRIPVEHLIRLASHYDVDLNYIAGISTTKRSFPRD